MISAGVMVMGSLDLWKEPQSPSPDPTSWWMCNLNPWTGSPSGPLGSGPRVDVSSDPPPTAPEANGRLGASEWPAVERAETRGHDPAPMSTTVESVAPQWPPACAPVAAVARPPRRRSPRRRPSRAAPDPPARRRGTRPSLPGLNSLWPWQVTQRLAGDPQRWQRSPSSHLQASPRCARRWRP